MNINNPRYHQESYSQCISFLVRHPDYCLNLLSKEFPFTSEQLQKYSNILDWRLLSTNTNIIWDFDLIFSFYDKISWKDLTINKNAFLDITLLDVFTDKIQWKNNIDEWGVSISANEGLPWTSEFIKKYDSKIQFKELSINRSVKWSEEIIDRYWGKWDLDELGNNEAFPWDLRLFDKYLGKEFLDDFLIQYNQRLLGNFDLVEKYKDKIKWSIVSSNPYLSWFEMNLLEYWENHIDWCGICQNEKLFKQDPNFYTKHLDIWESNKEKFYPFLSENQYFPWNQKLIQQYSKYWDWEAISRNTGIPWSIELIYLFVDHLYWGGMVDTFITEDKNGNSITPIPTKHFQEGIISNPSIPWSIEFLNKFESKLEFESLKDNHAVWEKVFKPIFDDQVLEIMLSKI